MTAEDIAKIIGSIEDLVQTLTAESTNRALQEHRCLDRAADAAADGYDRKYSEMLEQARKLPFTVKVLTDNNFPSALDGLERAIEWFEEHKDESIDKRFCGWNMLGRCLKIYRSEIKIAREAAGLTQQQLADMFDIPIDTIKSWDIGRRRPDRFKEKLILEKLESLKTERGL